MKWLKSCCFQRSVHRKFTANVSSSVYFLYKSIEFQLETEWTICMTYKIQSVFQVRFTTASNNTIGFHLGLTNVRVVGVACGWCYLHRSIGEKRCQVAVGVFICDRGPDRVVVLCPEYHFPCRERWETVNGVVFITNSWFNIRYVSIQARKSALPSTVPVPSDLLFTPRFRMVVFVTAQRSLAAW